LIDGKQISKEEFSDAKVKLAARSEANPLTVA